jgi:arylsulfatase A-like enzyme
VNVVLLVVDSLRRDAIGAFGAGAAAHTPNLDRLVRESREFDHAFAASYPTIPFRTDVMSGRHGTPFNPWKPLRFDVPTLPWSLAGAGYCTQLIHDTPHLVNGGHAFDWPFHGWTFVRGAEVDRPWIDDRPLSWLPTWRRDPGLDPFLDADENAVLGHILVTYTRANRGRREPGDWNVARLFSESARFVRENARRDNFFLWVDCFDPHEPWDAPPEFVRMHDPGDPDGKIDPRLFDYVWLRQSRGEPLGLPPAYEQRLRAQYAAKVSHMDRWLGVLLAALDDTGLADRTAVVLTADHGT